MHTKYGMVQFNKDDIYLPYINTKSPQDVDFLQTAKEKIEGFSKK